MNKIPVSHRFAFMAIIVIGFILLGFIALGIFRDSPLSKTEYGALYQARIFSSGHLSIPVDEKLESLAEQFTVISHHRLFWMFSPGWPALLALGLKVGSPCLTNPLISVGTLILLGLMGIELAGSLFSLLTLLLLITNSYFLGYGASYFSQPAALFLSTLVLFFYIKYKTKNKNLWLYAAALVISMLTLVRTLDAFCLWLALFIMISLSKTINKRKLLTLFCVWSSLGTVLLFLYNYVHTAKWCLAPYPVFYLDFQVLSFSQKTAPVFDKIIHAGNTYLAHLNQYSWPLLIKRFLPCFICWIPLLILSCWDLKKNDPDHKNLKIFFLIYGLIFLASYNLSRGTGWSIYGGSRFWYPLIAPIALLTVEGIAIFYALVGRRIFGVIFGFLILWQVFQLVNDLIFYDVRFAFVQKIQTDIDARCPGKAIVILNSPPKGTGNSFILWDSFKRNPFFAGPKLYVTTNRDLDLIQTTYPDYGVCNYYFETIFWKKPPSVYQKIIAKTNDFLFPPNDNE